MSSFLGHIAKKKDFSRMSFASRTLLLCEVRVKQISIEAVDELLFESIALLGPVELVVSSI